jgi:hypothetical protein
LDHTADFDGARLHSAKASVARQAVRDAVSSLDVLLTRLNDRPGTGINFALVYEIGRAEKRVDDARSTLNRLSGRGGV